MRFNSVGALLRGRPATTQRRVTRHLLGTALWATFSLAVCVAPAAQTVFSGLTPDRLWQLVRAGEPAVSPDGKWVAFTVTAYAENADLPSIDIWLVDSAGKDEPRQLTRNAGVDFDPAWAPDSRSIVYAAVTDDNPHSQIFLLNLRGGAPQPLTDLPTAAVRPRFAGSSNTVFFEASSYPDVGADFEAVGQRVAEAERRRRFARATDTRVVGSDGRDPQLVQHVFSLGLDTGLITDLMPTAASTGTVVPFEWDLSPNGRFLAYTANTSPPPYVSRNSDVFLLDVESGETNNLTAANPGSDIKPIFSRAGDALLFGQRRRPDALDEFRTLLRHDLRSGRNTKLTDPGRLSPEQWLTSEDGRQVYFLAQEQGRRKVFRVGAAGGKARALTDEGSYSGLHAGADNELFALHESLLDPPAIQRLDENGRHPRQLTRFNEAFLQNTRRPEVGEQRFSSVDGTEIHALVVRPPGWRSSVRWPVVIALHGGPHSAWLDEFNWRWNLALLASRGYLVVALNVRGSTGYGQAFASALNGSPLALPAEDVLSAASQLADEPYVDPQKIMLIGGSYGGLLTLWAVSQSDRFARAVVHAPVVEQRMIYGSDYPWGREVTWGRPPWRQPSTEGDPKLTASPSDRFQNIRTPVLALHGEADSRVSATHSRLLHNVLTDLGVSSRLVLFPEEGHSISR
ncbi:MAG: S9 family peptidase, partial [Pseudomonadota bacterium]